MIDLSPLLGVLGLRVFVVATGGGAGVQEALWRIPGASSFLVGAAFPYAASASAEFAGLTPDQYASEAFALDLAAAAYMRALPQGYASDPGQPVGLAVTANVASLKEHRGDHRVHVACLTRDRAFVRTVVLAKGAGAQARHTDGLTTDRIALDTLMVALFGREARPSWHGNTYWEGEVRDADQDARARFFAHPHFRRGWRTNGAGLQTFFPGTFNPPHQGHESIADKMAESSGEEPAFAICATPPHKPALTVQEMLQRANWLRHRGVLFSEGDPLYIDKARRWPGAWFAIGADALLRMFDPAWCSDPAALMKELHQLGTGFCVTGRRIDGVVVTAEEAIARVGGHRIADGGMFMVLQGIPTDLSSSAIRAAAQ